MLIDKGHSSRFGPAVWDLPSDLSFLKVFLDFNLSLLCLISSKFVWPIKRLSANLLSDWGLWGMFGEGILA